MYTDINLHVIVMVCSVSANTAIAVLEGRTLSKVRLNICRIPQLAINVIPHSAANHFLRLQYVRGVVDAQ